MSDPVEPASASEEAEARRLIQEAQDRELLRLMAKLLAEREVRQMQASKRFEESLKTAPPQRSLSEILDSPPDLAQWRVREPEMFGGHTLARCGQTIRMAGGPKAGKTSLMADFGESLLTGSKMLDHYEVRPLDEDQVIVVLDLEQDQADLYFAWQPYLEALPREVADRVVLVTLRGVKTDFLSEEIRQAADDLIRKRIDAQFPGREVRVGTVFVDPLFAAASGDFLYGVDMATEFYNDVVVGWLMHSLGAEFVLVAVHTSKAGGKTGPDGGLTYGSVGWDSKFEALWSLTRHMTEDGEHRVFSCQSGRARTGSKFSYRVVMDETTGRLSCDVESVAEATAEARTGVSAKPKTESKTAVTRAMVTQKMQSEAGPFTVGGLADWLGMEAARLEMDSVDVPFAVSQPTVSKVLAVMRESGLVSETADATDPKVKLLTWVGGGAAETPVPEAPDGLLADVEREG